MDSPVSRDAPRGDDALAVEGGGSLQDTAGDPGLLGTGSANWGSHRSSAGGGRRAVGRAGTHGRGGEGGSYGKHVVIAAVLRSMACSSPGRLLGFSGKHKKTHARRRKRERRDTYTILRDTNKTSYEQKTVSRT